MLNFTINQGVEGPAGLKVIQFIIRKTKFLVWRVQILFMHIAYYLITYIY